MKGKDHTVINYTWAIITNYTFQQRTNSTGGYGYGVCPGADDIFDTSRRFGGKL